LTLGDWGIERALFINPVKKDEGPSGGNFLIVMMIVQIARKYS